MGTVSQIAQDCPNVIMRVLISGKQEGQNQREQDVMTEVGVIRCWLGPLAKEWGGF